MKAWEEAVPVLHPEAPGTLTYSLWASGKYGTYGNDVLISITQLY